MRFRALFSRNGNTDLPMKTLFRTLATMLLLFFGLPYKRYVQIGEGTHTVIMEKNRMQLFQTVQQFFDEQIRVGQ